MVCFLLYKKKKEQKLFSTVLGSVITFQFFRNHIDALFQTHFPNPLLHLAAFPHLRRFPLLAGDSVALALAFGCSHPDPLSSIPIPWTWLCLRISITEK